MIQKIMIAVYLICITIGISSSIAYVIHKRRMRKINRDHIKRFGEIFKKYRDELPYN